VSNIFHDQTVEASTEQPHHNFIVPMAENRQPEWNIVHVKAHEAWRRGFTGKGMVLANSVFIILNFRTRIFHFDKKWCDVVRNILNTLGS
jgi:hypothetical protein